MFSKKNSTIALSAIFVLAIHLNIFAQEKSSKQEKPPKGWLLNIPKDTVVTLKIPFSVMDIKAGYIAVNIPKGYATADIEQSASGLVIGKVADWKSSGFPSMLELTVKRVKVEDDWRSNEKKAKHTLIELSGEGKEMSVLLYFKQNVTDINAAFKEVVALGRASDQEATDYLKQIYDDRAQRFFAGRPTELSEEKKLNLVRFAHKAGGSTTLKSETYKSSVFLVIDLGIDENVYNTLRMNQAARVARVINERLLALLKGASQYITDSRELQGVKLELKIPHKDFSNEYTKANTDLLQIYVPLIEIKRFVDAEITSQQLIDNSIVIVNDNRVQVPLSQTN